MTEAEWLACTDPQQMLRFLRGKAGERRLRFFRLRLLSSLVGHVQRPRRSRRAIEVAELHADVEANDEDLRIAMNGAEDVAEALATSVTTTAEEAHASAAFAAMSVTSDAETAADYTSSNAGSAAYHAATASSAPSAAEGRRVERIWQANILRDILGNPFCPSSISSSWLLWNDGVVARLARTAYEQRIMPDGTLDNGLLAILEDALEEAGCTDTDILGHLRGLGPHVRGCWPVDLCLGKS
jgi:hypothetical protein